ncbi:MAG: hypothetical protein ACXAB4_00515 [Candidatus Hodarchaeales archaeon]|jgi:hypothetical protein
MKLQAVVLGILALFVINLAYLVQPIQAQTGSETEEEDILVTLFQFIDLFPFEIIALPAICLIFSPKQPYLKRLAKSVVVISIAYLCIFFFLYKPLLVALRGYVISILLYLLFSAIIKAPDSESQEKLKGTAKKGESYYFFQTSS